jgi:hypothetical protein
MLTIYNDPDSVIVYGNEAAEIMLGYKIRKFLELLEK